jgi:uracil-DNA glycosylase
MAEYPPYIEESWRLKLEKEFNSLYFNELQQFLLKERLENTVFPPESSIFEALNLTPFNKVKVVILGQDPYHGPNQAHGLSFSVQDGIKPPPSLANIFKELSNDLEFQKPLSGNLSKWAKQGVLLLNATLTVRSQTPGSHQRKGWEQFTDAIIRCLSNEKEGLVFLLWGRYAQEKEQLIDHSKHFVLKAAHPSPFSAHNGFFGCKHFSKTNEILIKIGKEPVDWSL